MVRTRASRDAGRALEVPGLIRCITVNDYPGPRSEEGGPPILSCGARSQDDRK